MKFIVFHSIRAGQKTHREAKLAVTDVPEKTSASAVMSVLEQAGKATDFSEAGVPWGNHEVRSDNKLPEGTSGVEQAPTVSWEELQETREVRRVTLRLDPQHYGQIKQAAVRDGMSIQAWCVAALENAVKTSSQKEK